MCVCVCRVSRAHRAWSAKSNSSVDMMTHGRRRPSGHRRRQSSTTRLIQSADLPTHNTAGQYTSSHYVIVYSMTSQNDVS